MALYIIALSVLAILAVCLQTGRCKREIVTLKRIENVRFSQHGTTLLVQNYLTGKFIVLVNQIGFDGGVVRVLRADMLERCHTVHPELSRR